MSDAAPQLVDDPSTPGRSVPKKKANAPFLAHRNSQAARGAAEAAQQQAGAPQRSLAARILKWSVVALLLAIAGGQFVAGDPIWGYRGKYVKKHYWFPVSAASRGVEVYRLREGWQRSLRRRLPACRPCTCRARRASLRTG
jgi:hypothetical protein